MLLAVEGGGFFSSSATGYSKGLALLFLGRKSEERPMRVSPWNQYQLVEEESDPGFQLASCKARASRGCACFGRASAGLEDPSPPKVGPLQQQDDLAKSSSISENADDCVIENGDDKHTGKFFLKSSLKKPCCASVVRKDGDLHVASVENDSNDPGCIGKRKVQWTDTCGKELAEIREFEVSLSDNEEMYKTSFPKNDQVR
ncbi:hypothetical protein MKW94_018381 [Papaver nudicaule]|uniref:Uncharacterized protein n=1 Tax=Papaver nudicaule TaxID=74823 RepID=A0AA41RXA6_PAPNU|nr:hypothetical protein [Papaver nudicaule]